MLNNIFIIGTHADKTTRHTAEALKKNGVSFHFIDLALLTTNGHVEYCPRSREGSFTIFGKDYFFGPDSRFYVRLLDISRNAPSEELRLISQKTYELLSSILSATGSRVLNPPLKSFYNVSKMFHLGALKLTHSVIPDSISSTDPTRVRDFVNKHQGAVIVKGSSSSKTKATLVNQNDLDRLPTIKNAPPLFQERIEGVEVRMHYVAGSVFSEVIATHEIDYRFPNSRAEVVTMNYEASSELKSEARSIASQLGLDFLGIDFKFSEKNGLWYFLEANPMPCYHGYDIRSGWRISNEICSYLAG